MATTNQKAILYDDTCPLCVWYTDQFVKHGWLKEGNRIPFADLVDQGFIEQVDWERSRHEIPLVDLEGQQTLYGLDSLLHLIGRRAPFLERIGCLPLVYGFFKGLYAFVSYNRRVIVAKAQNEEQAFDCTPDFHWVYRTLFIGFGFVFALLVTFLLGEWVLPELGGVRLTMMLGVGWLLQLVYGALILEEEEMMEYAGQLAVMMVMGCGLLVPLLAWVVLSGLSSWFLVGLSGVLSFAIMLNEHERRGAYVGLDRVSTFIWMMNLGFGIILFF